MFFSAAGWNCTVQCPVEFVNETPCGEAAWPCHAGLPVHYVLAMSGDIFLKATGPCYLLVRDWPLIVVMNRPFGHSLEFIRTCFCPLRM